MKRAVLFLLAVFLYTGLYANDVYSGLWHRISDPVKVKERGINFYVFPDGTFDFNAHGNHYQYAGYTAVRIERDRFGKIRRVGNVYINYNRHGQVSRIGSVFIKYNRRGLVSRVGHKYIRYNRRGYYVVIRHRPYRPGYIYSTGYNYNVSCNVPVYTDYSSNFDNDYYADDDYNNDYYDDSDGDYYHRPERKPKKSSKNRRR